MTCDMLDCSMSFHDSCVEKKTNERPQKDPNSEEHSRNLISNSIFNIQY